jgi:hypothetical protein
LAFLGSTPSRRRRFAAALGLVLLALLALRALLALLTWTATTQQHRR